MAERTEVQVGLGRVLVGANMGLDYPELDEPLVAVEWLRDNAGMLRQQLSEVGSQSSFSLEELDKLFKEFAGVGETYQTALIELDWLRHGRNPNSEEEVGMINIRS